MIEYSDDTHSFTICQDCAGHSEGNCGEMEICAFPPHESFFPKYSDNPCEHNTRMRRYWNRHGIVEMIIMSDEEDDGDTLYMTSACGSCGDDSHGDRVRAWGTVRRVASRRRTITHGIWTVHVTQYHGQFADMYVRVPRLPGMARYVGQWNGASRYKGLQAFLDKLPAARPAAHIVDNHAVLEF